MNRFTIKHLFVTGLLVSAISLPALAKETPKTDDVIATVNGTDITLGDVQLYMSSKAATGAPADPGSILNEVINRELIRQAAIKDGLDKSKDFKKAMEVQKTNLLVNAELSKHLEKADLSDEALKKEYDKQIKGADQKEYKARHILVKTEDEAKAVVKSLNDGADFIKLAKEKSIGPSGPNGGDLGWFQAGTMVPAFADAVKKLDKGKITETPVKTQFGWHVIKLEDSRKLNPPSFESSKEKLRSVVANKTIQEFLESLHKSAKVKLNQPPGSQPAEKKAK